MSEFNLAEFCKPKLKHFSYEIYTILLSLEDLNSTNTPPYFVVITPLVQSHTN